MRRSGQLSNLVLCVVSACLVLSCASKKSKLEEELQSPDKRSDYLMQMGTGAYLRGDWPSAVEDFQRSLVANPKNSSAHNNLGLAYLALGQKEQARGEYQAAINIDGNPDAHINMGQLAEENQNYEEARRHFRAAIDNLTYRTRHRALTSMGELELRMNNVDEARRWLYQSVQANPEYCLSHQLLGNIYMRENNPRAASGEFRKAVKSVCVRNVQAHYDLAQAYLRLKDYPKARSELSLLIETYPETIQGQKAGDDLKLVP